MSEPAATVAGRERARTMADFDLAGRHVQPSLNRVTFGATTLQVEPKVMRVLVCLAARPAEVVTKEELLEAVWDGVFVTEDVLVRAVRELRKLFGDDSETPRVIETIRKRGYRLIAPIGVAARPAVAREEGRRRFALAVGALAAVAVAAVMVARPRAVSRAPTRFVPVTTMVGNEYDPALSPDGTRVVFAWDGGHDGPTDLFVVMSDGGSPVRLTAERGSDRAPVWSADGRRIAFLRVGGGRCELRAVSPLGGRSDKLMDCTNPHWPRFSWSPDGGTLAVSRAEGAGAMAGHLQLVALATGAARDLTPVSGGAHVDGAPVFSPDGRRVAFLRSHSDSVGDVFVVDIADGRVQRLTEDNADVMGLTWSDQGRALVFSSNRAGMYSLWRVPAAGGEPELVVGGGRKIKHPSAVGAGDRIVYEAWNYDMNLWRAPAGSGSPLVAAPVAPASDEWTFEPQFSPDGSRIVFTSTRSGSYELWLAEASGAGLRRLTSFGEPFVGSARWSPDGRRLAFVARPHGRADLYVVEADGSGPRRLAAHPLDALAPGWSADGRAVYFGSRRDGSWQVHRVDVESGEVHRVTRDGGYAAMESPDGRWLYYTRVDRAGLWRQRSAGGAEELVTSDLAPEDAAGWGVSAAGVYWTARPRADGPAVVRLLPAGGGPLRDVGELTDQAWPGVSLSPNGRALVYSRLEHRDSNLVAAVAGRRP
jgi:Tol biopolymer transport system component/DNA-binding winged helix-turn-helix (wHTH) protein